MAMDGFRAAAMLHKARADLRYAQRELYLARTAPRLGRTWLRRKERCVLDALTQVFNMQQCERRLAREAAHRLAHWRAFI